MSVAAPTATMSRTAAMRTGATTAQLNSAVALLGDNHGASPFGDLKGAGAVVVDVVIDQTIDTAQWVADQLPHDIFGWIVDAVAKVHETFEQLTGDTSQIGAHVGALMRASQQVASQQAQASGCGSAVGQIWQGQAYDSFSTRIRALGRATGAVSGVLTSAAERHLVLAGQLASAKRGLIELTAELVRELCNTAFTIVRSLGLVVAAGVWVLGAAALGGGISGGFKGAVNGFTKGGFGGMISGGFHGAVSGAKGSVEAVLKVAFDRFVQWAMGRVGQALQRIAVFVRQNIDVMTATLGQIADTGMRSQRAAALLRGQSDPGSASDGPSRGSYGDRARGADPQAMDGDLIALNQAMGSPDAPLPPGYSRATDADLAALGLTRAQLTDPNGFQAEVFRTPEGGYVVAFAGTGAAGGQFQPDAVEDGIGGATVSPQTQQVLAISDAIERSSQGDQVVYTGHSLGGRQAAIAAINSGQPAVTYDAAGVSQATVNYVAERNGDDPAALISRANDDQIRRYYASDDPLTAFQEGNGGSAAAALPDAIGRPYPLGDAPGNNPSAGQGVPDFAGHDLSHAGDLWEQRYGSLRE
ncbi:hypothetical protein [Aestuariimicrobium sp. T2.26MG-19.2B]|uniref:hypothetical protein n=1 Tax=Aestuariimicrobium sp. T2.26MG-19.2B TaxID=3040679 RepID=UPI00247798DD|nr:hypothetical protein [Aestuariimicrobium sp. T2.26MG-19.2B]CAI9409393.1 hypothetical protein AESSP_02226 [Aestuariimicrobium sp. T2.26MG-19.2B]